MVFSPNAAAVYRDGPFGSPAQPDKAQIRALLGQYETVMNALTGGTSARAKATLADLHADLNYDADTMIWVYADPVTDNNGVYQKIGATGLGSWEYALPLPYTFIMATDTGSGGPNAIIAESPIPVVNGVLTWLRVAQENDASPVTVSFNGDPPLTIKTNSGSDIAVGGLKEDMVLVGIRYASEFQLESDQASAAVIAEAEAFADQAEIFKNAAEAAAGSLLFRIYSDVAAAQAATIASSASYIAIASFSPQPRFYKRFTSDPGTGDRFQSADGAWWQGLPLPGTTIDYVNAVQRTANASLVSGDLDKAHRWTIPDGATYTVTLPNPATNVGRVLDIGVNDTSRGLLAVAYTTNPIGKYAAGGLFMWAGESMTLIARATEWEIVGGRCIPCTLYATAPGPDQGMTSGVALNLTGWQSSLDGTMYTGAEHAINGSGQIVIPRQGFYTLELDVSFAWTVAPTSLYATAHVDSVLNRYFSRVAGTNEVLHPRHAAAFSAGTVLAPSATASGGTSVGVRSTTFGPPQFKLIEAAQW